MKNKKIKVPAKIVPKEFPSGKKIPETLRIKIYKEYLRLRKIA